MGDFTPYWEDGAASTAKATGTNREACERIAQAQILWAMLRPELALHERFDAAWIKLAMYDEHTWGAWNSISHPDDSFAIQQDEYKQAYAFDGARLTQELLRDISAPAAGAEAVDVYNTAAWTRGGLVRLTREQSAVGDRVKDDTGRAVPSQRLASGELAFVAAEVPAFGARRYTLHAGRAESGGAAKAEGRRLSNGLLRLEVDAQSGAIQSLRRAGVDADWVDTASAEGINSYLYIIGRNANEGRARVAGPAVVVVEDPGPLVATLRIESDAPGCERLAMQEQGGSMATVQEVHVVQAGAVRRGNDRAFSVVLTWTVEGTVEHWGHIHTRVNQYTAEFSAQPVEAAWKITAMNVTDLRRVRYQVRLRSF